MYKKDKNMTDETQVDITSEKMPDELKYKLEKLSPLARRYAEYRAKGLKQPDAASKAGSDASTRSSLGRVGWNTEQLDGVKEYILWLEHKRAKASVIDDLEIINNLRDVYEQAMSSEKFGDANKAMELLCKISGAFEADNKQKQSGGAELSKTKNDTKSFTEDNPEMETKNRIKKLQTMLQDTKK